jgi:uncharacterized lipoprotein YajG
MKKILLVVMIFLLAGCATATYKNGDVTLTVKRPIFAAVSASATSSKGDIVSINAATSAQLDQLVGMALQGYAQYQSMGLLKAPNPATATVSPPEVTETTK